MTVIEEARKLFLAELDAAVETQLERWEEHVNAIGIEKGKKVEKQLPIDDAGKEALIRFRTEMFWDLTDELSEQVYTGEISIGQWQETMKQSIRELHTSTAAIGKGGWDEMEPADWGRLGPRLKDQYRWLQGFAEHIDTNREDVSLKQIKARARLYGEAAAGSSVVIEAGVVFEAKLPWLPRDGSTPCLNRCHCQWRQTIIGKEGEFNIVESLWQLGQADHCETCRGREGHLEVNRIHETVVVPDVIGGY